jgi:hypothetical protein
MQGKGLPADKVVACPQSRGNLRRPATITYEHVRISGEVIMKYLKLAIRRPFAHCPFARVPEIRPFSSILNCQVVRMKSI